MKHNFFRFFGVILIGTAIAGVLLSIVGLVTIWTINQDLTGTVSDAIDSIDGILVTTAQGLLVTEDSLNNAISNLDSLNYTLLSTGEAINSSTPLISTFSTVLTEELPNTLYATQDSLTTAQSSARLIESVLTSVTGIPFFPGEPYKPETPLYVTLGEVSESLDPLVDSMLSMKSGLRNTQTNLFIIDLELKAMTRQISLINTSLSDAKEVIIEFQVSVSELQEQFSLLKEKTITWINVLTWILTVGFVWLGFAQLGLVLQGYQLVKSL
jgi:methyl-accepting chemotaxis protein